MNDIAERYDEMQTSDATVSMARWRRVVQTAREAFASIDVATVTPTERAHPEARAEQAMLIRDAQGNYPNWWGAAARRYAVDFIAYLITISDASPKTYSAADASCKGKFDALNPDW